jgi:phosphoheptose isomerase
MKNEIKEKFIYSIECKTKVINDDKIIEKVEETCNAIINCYKQGHRV